MADGSLQYILSLSYGKDSIACLGAIERLGWPLDRIIHAEVWATDTIPADLPPMVEFKARADTIIKDRWGITVEHIKATRTFEQLFYRRKQVSKYENRNGNIYGWPMVKHPYCNSMLKMEAINRAKKVLQEQKVIQYIGIAADEPKRFHNLTNKVKSPLVELGWEEQYCREWCLENGLLSPTYDTSTRGGCWFCVNQRIEQLRILRREYPDLWAILLKWDGDNFTTGTNDRIYFGNHGHMLKEYEKRFQLEDEHLLDPYDKSFRWAMLDEPLQYRLF